MSFYNHKVTFGGVDVSDFLRDFRFTLAEPKRVADNPHAPGTDEHRQWEYANVHVPRQSSHSAEREQATKVADERIARVKAARTGGAAPRTFAYGKDVDELLAFIADDTAGPLVADFAETEPRPLRSGDFLTAEDLHRTLYGLKFDWPSAGTVRGLLGGTT